MVYRGVDMHVRAYAVNLCCVFVVLEVQGAYVICVVCDEARK